MIIEHMWITLPSTRSLPIELYIETTAEGVEVVRKQVSDTFARYGFPKVEVNMNIMETGPASEPEETPKPEETSEPEPAEPEALPQYRKMNHARDFFKK